MASFRHLLQHTTPTFESPSKVFARLKSKVQREAIHATEDTFTGSDPLCNVRDTHGSVFKSPRKRAATWMTDELKTNQRSGSYRNDVQALTLSPISSPEETFVHPDIISKHVKEKPPVTKTGHGCTPRNRAFLESTALPHAPKSHQTRDSGGFEVISTTPVNVRRPVDNDFESSVFVEGCAPLDPRMSRAFMFSPTGKRFKIHCEPGECNRVTSSTKEVSNAPRSQTQERKTSRAFSGDKNTCTEGLGNVRALSAASEANHEPVFPSTMKHSYVRLETFPPMSPAKMFTYMKNRESKTKQQEAHKVSSSMRDLFNTSDSHPSSDTSPPSNVHSMGEMEDIAFRSVPESVAPVNRSRVESADSLWDAGPSEEALRPAVSPQPVSLEDPLVLNTPRISIPKKQNAVFKRNKWPQSIKFPSERVIYLKKWFLRRNHKGLFVDGIHREENIPWNSNIIVARVSNNVVKTVSGSVYILSGKMNMSADSGLPKWLLKKFANGFPPDWEALYERFLSESSNRETERNREGGGATAKTKSETSSITDTVKRQKNKSFKTPDSSLPASLSRPNVSRSGRVIKPPLEYWKGGRVLLDAHMNVTIHECYDASICIPVSTTASTRPSQKPPCVFPPCSTGRQQCASASDKEASVPLRRVKAPLRKRNSAKSKPENKPSYSPAPPVETLRSPEEWSGRQTRSSRRHPATEKTLYVDTVPQKQREPEKSSRKQTRNSTRSSVRVLGSKRAVPAPPKSFNDSKTSASSDEEVNWRMESGKKVGSRRAFNKSRPIYVFPSSESSESSEEIEKEVGKRTRVTQTKQKQSKSTIRPSSPTKPLSKLTQTSKKKPTSNKGNAPIPQEHDAGEWTEAELMKLQEAVSCYPKHVAGYWAKVARMVGTRSAEECHFQHTSQGTSHTPARRATKKKLEAPKDTDHPVISARAGTLKRKQQVRQFLETMPREDVEDVFSSAYMQNKRFEMPSMSQSDHDFTLTEMEPLTPMSTGFPEVKTPQCLHITPGMMGSPNRNNDDKYVYQLQKRMKNNQFNVCKKAPSSKSFTPTPSVKRTMRRCGNTENDSFLVWEMFPGDDGVLSESGEEEDFYFSDND